MGFGIVILIVSAIWAVILATKTVDIFGQKVLVLGDNLLGSNTYALSSEQYIFFWVIAIIGILLGVFILSKSGATASTYSDNTSNANNTGRVSHKNTLPDTKECPFCAETVKRAAKICRYCNKDLPEIIEPVLKIYNLSFKGDHSTKCPICDVRIKLSEKEMYESIFDCPDCNNEIQFKIKEESLDEQKRSPLVEKNESYSQAPITSHYNTSPEESQQSYEKNTTEQLSQSVPACKNSTLTYVTRFVFLIVVIIGGTYFYKTKVNPDKFSNMNGNGNAAAPVGNQPTNALASTKKVNNSELVQKYCGTWEYDQYGSKSYFRISKVGNGRYRFEPGNKYEGKITFQDPMLKNVNGIYLKNSNGKLKGKFISGNFYATHAQEYTYTITLESKSDTKLVYSVHSSIRGETDVSEATKVSG